MSVTPPNDKTQAALFLQSPSPGAVFRFMERRRPADAPESLYLSDALSPNGWRAMPGNRAFLTAQAPFLSRPFPPAIYLFYWDESGWGWTCWENGDEKEGFEDSLPPSPPTWKTFLSVIGVTRNPLSPPLAWAQTRGLPLFRIPGAIPGAKLVPVIEYRTVSGLDQRNLLLETGPRLYRFELREKLIDRP